LDLRQGHHAGPFRFPAFYASADLFVLSSTHEGPNVMIEAHACGIPSFRRCKASG